MEELTRRKTYSAAVASEIEARGAMAVSIANRWKMGWPDRVAALLKAGTYLSCLETQVEQEKAILANEADLRHLARHEILQMYEIRESPPSCSLSGLVAETGEESYFEVEYNASECSEFVRHVVIPLLGREPHAHVPQDLLVSKLVTWLEIVRPRKEGIEICYDHQTDWDL